MTEDDNNHLSYLNNTVNFSVEPVYPDDELRDVDSEVRQLVTATLGEMLKRMAMYILPAKDSRLTLGALFFASGVDLTFLTNTNNEEKELAKVFGISKQKFSLLVKQVRADFNLNHASTATLGNSEDSYNNHYRKPQKE